MSEAPRCCKHVTPKARKAHECCECNGTISKGETYHRISGVWDEPETFKRCNDCQILVDKIDAEPTCEDGVPFGRLYEYVTDQGAKRELLIEYVENALRRGATVQEWILNRLRWEER